MKHFGTLYQNVCTHRKNTFLDKLPEQDNWKLSQIMQFSTYLSEYGARASAHTRSYTSMHADPS